MTDDQEMAQLKRNSELNVRTIAVDKALFIAAHNNKIGSVGIKADEVIADAKKIEAFISGEQVSTAQA